jgi:NAD(P)-dependent dehydrogenase (short-subunit alcohol dehydrogenase family)
MRRVAIITGAAHGIGRAIARHLIEAGWRIGAVDLPSAGLTRTFRPVDAMSSPSKATWPTRPLRASR